MLRQGETMSLRNWTATGSIADHTDDTWVNMEQRLNDIERGKPKESAKILSHSILNSIKVNWILHLLLNSIVNLRCHILRCKTSQLVKAKKMLRKLAKDMEKYRWCRLFWTALSIAEALWVTLGHYSQTHEARDEISPPIRLSRFFRYLSREKSNSCQRKTDTVDCVTKK